MDKIIEYLNRHFKDGRAVYNCHNVYVIDGELYLTDKKENLVSWCSDWPNVRKHLDRAGVEYKYIHGPFNHTNIQIMEGVIS